MGSQQQPKGISYEFGTVITAYVAGGTIELDEFPNHLQHLASAYIFELAVFILKRFESRLASSTSIIPNLLRQRCSVATEICFCYQNCSWLR
jgi:hypothetical protein